MTGKGSVISAGVQTTWTLCVFLGSVCVCMCVCLCVIVYVSAPEHFSSTLFPAMSICHRILETEGVNHSASSGEKYIPALSVHTPRSGLSLTRTLTHRATDMCAHSSRIPRQKKERILFTQLLLRVCEWIPLLISPPKRAKRTPHYQPLWWAFCAVVARRGHNIAYDVALGLGNMDKIHVCCFILIKFIFCLQICSEVVDRWKTTRQRYYESDAWQVTSKVFHHIIAQFIVTISHHSLLINYFPVQCSASWRGFVTASLRSPVR